jgi:hypothetical protein
MNGQQQKKQDPGVRDREIRAALDGAIRRSPGWELATTAT